MPTLTVFQLYRCVSTNDKYSDSQWLVYTYVIFNHISVISWR